MKYLWLFLIFAFVFLLVSDIQATEYVAFSLRVAQDRILSSPKGQDYRKLHPEVFYLGGITAVRGLVYDRKTADAILVGEKDSTRAALTLDDFVVALRARFIHGKWPLVSIDPTEETKKTEMQIVRFEGGIENTQFGQDLFDADYRLKQISMGLLPPGAPKVTSEWDLLMEGTKASEHIRRSVKSRYWFYPILPSVTVREDVVALKGLKVGVFTEVLSAEIDGKKIEDLSIFHDVTGDLFAKMVSDNFHDLAGVHTSFLKLQGFVELVALSKAMEEMDDKPDLSYWLTSCQIKRVQTKTELKVLRKKEDFTVSKVGVIHRGSLEISGGVQLKAIALRLQAGEVAALKEAILRTRPHYDSLSWSFIVGEWLIPTSPDMVKMEDIAALFTQAVFLQEKRRYDDAIVLYGKISDLKPDWDLVYNNRGIAFNGNGQYDQAMSDFSKALEINTRFVEAYTNRGNAFSRKGQYDQAILDYNKALEINPRFVKAYYNRGATYYAKNQYDQAILDYNKALEINPRLPEAYHNRGNAYSRKNQYDQAISDYSKALEINPRLADTYYTRGNAYHNKREFGNAIVDYSKALEINPMYVDAYNNRAVTYAYKGLYDQAILDYNKVLELNPRHADSYFGRGNAFRRKGLYDQAIRDYDKGITINPGNAEIYNNRGIAYYETNRYDQAILDYNKALEINPEYADAYYNRATAYAAAVLYDQAILNCNKALEINPRFVKPHFLKGLVYEQTGRSKEAIDAYINFIESAPAEYLPLINQAKERIKELGGRRKW